MGNGLAAWNEWKARCALGLCGVEARAALRAFAEARFRHFAQAAGDAAGPAPAGEPDVSGPDAWHLFETHLTVNTTAAGKRYKDWLFARVDGVDADALDTICGGATLLMRDVVREHLRRERSPSWMASLDRPVCESEGVPLTFGDLLPDSAAPGQEPELRELAAMARERAAAFFAEMSRREKTVLLAKTLGLSLAHPAVEQEAGCLKSMLSAACGAALRRLVEQIRADHPGEDEETVRLLSAMTLSELRDRAERWGKSEKSVARLFLIVEGRVSGFAGGSAARAPESIEE